VIGYPGAAYLGPGIPTPFLIKKAEVRGANAVVISNEGEAWMIRGLGSAVDRVLLDGSFSDVFLDSAARMGLLVMGSGEFRLATDLDGSPSLHPGVPDSALTGTRTAVAFNEESRCALMAASDAEAVRIYTLCENIPAEPRLLRVLDPMAVGAMTYSSRHGGLLIADRGAGRVIRIGAPLDAGAVDVIAEGVVSPVGIQPLSRDEILVAQSEPAQAAVIDLRHGVTRVIELYDAPTQLTYLVPDRILTCNRVNRTPLLVIDLAQDRESFLIPSGDAP
jgi:hypothetical protein